jgi:hypothetical protein
MIVEMKPWLKYPDLKQEYLTVIANTLRRVRSECVALHEPENGDGNWSLGSRVYERSFYAIKELAKTVDWLTINPELYALAFSFCIGSVPLRIYKGEPDDPPSRYLSKSEGEQLAFQLCIEFDGLPTVDTMLRLAVTVDATREARWVTLVEIDEQKEVVGMYSIPFEGEASNITPLQAPKVPPVSMPPAVAVPINKETTEEKETPSHGVA